MTVVHTDKQRAPVELSIDGTIVDGFERGEVMLTMAEGANTFGFEYVPEATHLEARSIFAGDPIELRIDAGSGYETLIEGYVDQTEEDDDPTGLRLSCSGRSKTGDLIDCSLPQVKWVDAELITILDAICEPFGIYVSIVGKGEADLVYPSGWRERLRGNLSSRTELRPICLLRRRGSGACSGRIDAHKDRARAWRERHLITSH